MTSAGIPRPFGVTDAKRRQEEEARKREQATSARNTSSTTIGSGGRLDVVGGDLTVSEGGNAVVRDGGRFLVEGGGSMEILDDGVVKVVGSTVDDLTDAVMVAEAALSTEEVYHTSSGVVTRSPGLFFKTERAEGGKVHSAWGDDVGITSGMRLVDYGPLVEAGVYKNTASRVSPSSAGLYASAFFSTTPDIADQRSQCYIEAYPDAIVAELFSVALGRVGGINVSIADPKLRLYGRDGVDVKGPFTVDGAPVGGAVDSVAGKTGAVTLVKADVGLGNVDNTSDAAKPVSTATQAALDGKASTAVATPTVNGLMASTDKAKLNAATPNATANALIQRDTSGRAQVASPAVAADIANKGYVDSSSDAVIRGTDGKKYRIIACTVRNTGSGFTLINDAAHVPIGVTGVTTAADSFTLQFSFTAKTIGSLVATGDEAMSDAGYIFGSSVGLSTAVFYASQPGGAADYVYYSGGWKSFNGFVTGISMNSTTGLITCTHSAVTPDVGGTITSRSLTRHGVLDSMSATQTFFYFVDSAGTPDKTPRTEHRMWIHRAGARRVAMSELTTANSNIWIYGVMEVD